MKVVTPINGKMLSKSALRISLASSPLSRRRRRPSLTRALYAGMLALMMLLPSEWKKSGLPIHRLSLAKHLTMKEFQRRCSLAGCSREDLLQLLADALTRSLRASSSAPPAWHDATAILLPKTHKPTCTSAWRPITIVSISKKIFSKVILWSYGALLHDLHPSSVGFKPGGQTGDLVHTFRSIHQRSHEWRHPVFLAYIDAWQSLNALDFHHEALSAFPPLLFGHTCAFIPSMTQSWSYQHGSGCTSGRPPFAGALCVLA
eukprot:6421993-Amphidinium_carterae.1